MITSLLDQIVADATAKRIAREAKAKTAKQKIADLKAVDQAARRRGNVEARRLRVADKR